MPVAPTYPGVYIEEVPSGVHTITGVSTSIAAFVGYASRGTVDEAVQLFRLRTGVRRHRRRRPAEPVREALLPERRHRGVRGAHG